MKIINFTPTNSYDCMFCQKEFQSPMELEVIWFCSNSCKYRYAFSIVISVYPKASKENKYALTKKIVEVSLT